jgi:hypothetical protein
MPEQVEDTENFNATKDCSNSPPELPGLTQTDLALGQLAFLLAFANALGKRRRRRLVAMLDLIAKDWRRDVDCAALRQAAERIVGPAAQMIAPPPERSDRPDA